MDPVEEMMNEAIFLGGRPVTFGVGDVGDLLAYRQEWEPFIKAHLDLWRYMNSRFEVMPEASKCPAGTFTAQQTAGLDPTTRVVCDYLGLTRLRLSDNPGEGILPRWNAWKDKSSADIVAGASTFLQWHQEVVMLVGGQYAQELIDMSKYGAIPLQLPEVPTFSEQQELRARIEGAYITAKGVIQLIGYSAGQILGEASDLVDATAKGLTDAAKKLPDTIHWVAVAAGITAVAVVGGLVIYYLPRRSPELPAP